MDAGGVAVVGLVNPVVGTVLGIVLLAEPFDGVSLLAMVVTLGSVVLAQEAVRRRVASAPGSALLTMRHASGRVWRTPARPRRTSAGLRGTDRNTVGACPT